MTNLNLGNSGLVAAVAVEHVEMGAKPVKKRFAAILKRQAILQGIEGGTKGTKKAGPLESATIAEVEAVLPELIGGIVDINGKAKLDSEGNAAIVKRDREGKFGPKNGLIVVRLAEVSPRVAKYGWQSRHSGCPVLGVFRQWRGRSCGPHRNTAQQRLDRILRIRQVGPVRGDLGVGQFAVLQRD